MVLHAFCKKSYSERIGKLTLLLKMEHQRCNLSFFHKGGKKLVVMIFGTVVVLNSNLSRASTVMISKDILEGLVITAVVLPLLIEQRLTEHIE
uniref:Uncharacterized protein n=1 Tax=Romanomermis culicivorax TaxID=13658 RepID=A0A915ING9_ROMCU